MTKLRQAAVGGISSARVADPTPPRTLAAALPAPRGVPGFLPRLVEAPAPRPAIVGYLSDFVVVAGAQTLFDQADRLDGSCHAPHGLAARYVDSGRQDGPPRMGPALVRLLADARVEGYRAVLVDNVARFGPDLMTAFRVAIEVIEAGLEIYEAEGARVEIDDGIAARLAKRAS